jgi:hypothetical protein
MNGRFDEAALKICDRVERQLWADRDDQAAPSNGGKQTKGWRNAFAVTGLSRRQILDEA